MRKGDGGRHEGTEGHRDREGKQLKHISSLVDLFFHLKSDFLDMKQIFHKIWNESINRCGSKERAKLVSKIKYSLVISPNLGTCMHYSCLYDS